MTQIFRTRSLGLVVQALQAGVFAPRSWVGDRKLLRSAEAARDAGRWQEAADRFAAYAARHAHRHEILVQLGNCAKESGNYARAYAAFRGALGSASRRDAELQIGHLFKVTGNFAAARAAFGRARDLGERDAAGEYDGAGPHWLGALRIAPPRGGGRPVPPDAVKAVLALDFGDEPEAPLLHGVAEHAHALGEMDVAKAFHELACLVAGHRQPRAETVAIAVRTGLWPTDHIIAVKRAERDEGDNRALLRTLVAAAAQQAGHDGAVSPTKFLPIAVASPAQLDAQEAHALFATLTGAIACTYAAFTAFGGRSGPFIEALRGLDAATRPAFRHVAFAPAATIDDFRLHAARVLRDTAATWLAMVEEAYLGRRATLALIEAFLALDRNPVAERLANAGSPAPLFDDMLAILANLSLAPEASDPIIARVLTVATADMGVHEIRALFDEALRRNHLRTAVALVERLMTGPGVDPVETATRFKQAGAARHALALLERHLHEPSASPAALIEKALIAKTCGAFPIAARLLESRAAAQPDDAFVRRELVAVLPEIEPIEAVLARFQHDALFLRLAAERSAYGLRLPAPEGGERIGTALVDGVRVVDLAPEIATEFLPVRSREEREGIARLQMGWMSRRGPGLNETRPLLRRHDFIRVQTAFPGPVARLRVRLNGRTVGMAEGTPTQAELANPRLRHLMFNCWIDLSAVTAGLHELQLYFEEPGGGYRTHEETVWVDPAPPSPESLASAATVDLDPSEGIETLEARIARRPSIVFDAARRLVEPPRRILVIRVDQLGDLITTLPAMLRLRECFPEAELSCLVAPNYRHLVDELGIFTEIFTLDFPYEIGAEKRHLTLARQAELRRELGARGFDVAIDLCFGHMSRPLLRLAQAKFTVGFWPQEFPWLDFGLDLRTRDVVTGRYRMPQQAVATMLVDALASLANHRSVEQPRRVLDWGLLAPFGVDAEHPYVLVHTGGRTASRKWPIPYFVTLARMTAERTGLRVLVIADDPADFDAASRNALAHDAIRLIEHRLPFPDLDTLLSAATVFVGNDSGPKHLAAFRGTRVVSIHAGPMNWSEWGQDGVGRIIVHRVPCFGCGIERVDECGKDLACLTAITPEEVFAVVEAELVQVSKGVVAEHGFDAAGPVT